MCGVTGFLGGMASRSGAELEALAGRMAHSLHHRGPDGSGAWADAEHGLALGHTRLAVIDLSPTGQQPMVSSDGRFVIVYNGEVYNHIELRQELEAAGCRFRGSSDTEVVLEGCARWGVRRATERMNGMFAFAIWDRRDAKLMLVRDRVGIKPLYWAQCGNGFLFGSELKALHRHPAWSVRIDRAALTTYMRIGYIPAPRSIFENVFKLVPGAIMTLQAGREPHLVRYWSAPHVADDGLAHRIDLEESAAADELERLLEDAVGREMIADVPLGAFLSGGIDSSTVVALMQKQSHRPVKTFSIGFHSKVYNEAAQAKAVSRYLGTDHVELYVDPQHALDVIPRLPEWYDEPMADASQIVTYLVAHLARQQVTVVLTGDGGDELFHGYDRYAYASALWSKWAWLPRSSRRVAALLVDKLLASPGSRWDRIFEALLGQMNIIRPIDKLGRLSAFLAAESPDALNRVAITRWEAAADLVVGGREEAETLYGEMTESALTEIHDRLQLLDFVTYLPDDLLTKVDRATMAISLEARVPLLDHRVVEFAWRLPYHLKYGGGRGKKLLRSVLSRHVPRDLVDRRKMGFSVPIGEWLRGSLREWAEELLNETRLRQAGFFDPRPIRVKWEEHLSGSRNWDNALWVVLLFQSWAKEYGVA